MGITPLLFCLLLASMITAYAFFKPRSVSPVEHRPAETARHVKQIELNMQGVHPHTAVQIFSALTPLDKADTVLV